MNAQGNLYRAGARFYDLDPRDNVTHDLPFYLNYAARADGPVLELGCGTGRVALTLARAGYAVTGLDLSDAMLEVFREKRAIETPAVRDRICIVQGDMADFRLDERFALVTAPFRAFQFLTEDGDARNCLRAVRNHLTPNGRFIVNVFRPYAVLDQNWCYPARVTWEGVDPSTGRRVVKKSRGERIDTERQLLYVRDFTEVDGTDTFLEDLFTLRYYYYGQLSTLLAEAGFRIMEEYGWYDKTPIETGRELIMIAGRKEDAL